MKVSKQTYQDMKAGVKLAGRITKHTANQVVSTVKQRPLETAHAKHWRTVEWRCATKTAKTTAKVAATCAAMLVGGLFAAIIAD